MFLVVSVQNFRTTFFFHALPLKPQEALDMSESAGESWVGFEAMSFAKGRLLKGYSFKGYSFLGLVRTFLKMVEVFQANLT